MMVSDEIKQHDERLKAAKKKIKEGCAELLDMGFSETTCILALPGGDDLFQTVEELEFLLYCAMRDDGTSSPCIIWRGLEAYLFTGLLLRELPLVVTNGCVRGFKKRNDPERNLVRRLVGAWDRFYRSCDSNQPAKELARIHAKRNREKKSPADGLARKLYRDDSD